MYASGTTVDYLATGASTGGLFGLYRWSMPGTGGPGPHFHRTMTECFYVLVGRIKIYDGTAWRDCEPGDFVHVPIGGIHGFRNESGAPASMLIHFAPGAPREGYFEGNARFATEGSRAEELAASTPSTTTCGWRSRRPARSGEDRGRLAEPGERGRHRARGLPRRRSRRAARPCARPGSRPCWGAR